MMIADCLSQFLFQVCRDLLPMKSTILDKNLVGSGSSDDHPRHVNSGDVTLKRNRIANRTALLAGKLNAHRPQEFVVGMVSGERKYEVILDSDLAFRSL